MEVIVEAFGSIVGLIAEFIGGLIALLAEVLLSSLLWVFRPVFPVERQKRLMTEGRREVVKRLFMVLLVVGCVVGILWLWLPIAEDEPTRQIELTPEMKEKTRRFIDSVEKAREERKNGLR